MADRPRSAPGRRAAHRGRAPRALRIVLIAVVAVVVVTVGGTLAFGLTVGHSYDAKRHVVTAFPPAADRPAAVTGTAAKAVNVLLLGTDVDAVDDESDRFDGKPEADTVMLLHVPADRSRLQIVSILRDTLVDVPGHGRLPIDAAYAEGGVEGSVATVERLLDVRVDHVVSVDLTGLKGLTDAVGGVTVDDPAPSTSTSGRVFPAGRVALTGADAQEYLRTADRSATGDDARADAQERYFRGLLAQVLSAKVLLNPAAIAATASVFSPYLTTDRGLDSATVASLGFSLRNVRSSDVRTYRPQQSGFSRVGGQSVVLLDQAALQDLRHALRTDDLAGFKG